MQGLYTLGTDCLRFVYHLKPRPEDTSQGLKARRSVVDLLLSDAGIDL